MQLELLSVWTPHFGDPKLEFWANIGMLLPTVGWMVDIEAVVDVAPMDFRIWDFFFFSSQLEVAVESSVGFCPVIINRQRLVILPWDTQICNNRNRILFCANVYYVTIGD